MRVRTKNADIVAHRRSSREVDGSPRDFPMSYETRFGNVNIFVEGTPKGTIEFPWRPHKDIFW